MSCLAQKPGRLKLSRNLLEMKFMKKTKEDTLREEDRLEREAIYSSDLTQKPTIAESTEQIHVQESTVKKQHTSQQIVCEKSYIPLMNLRFGHLSYGGLNREVERFMAEERGETFDDVDVSDGEAAEFFHSQKKKASRVLQEESVTEISGKKKRRQDSTNKSFSTLAKKKRVGFIKPEDD